MFRESKKTQTFKGDNLFAGLPDSVCREVLSTARPREFKRKDFIFSAGSAAEKVFLLTKGNVRIIQVTERGEEVTLRFDKPGDIIGTLKTRPQGTHETSAQAIWESEALVWDTPTFEAALNRFPILQANTQRILELRIQEMERKVVETSTAKASSRLALELVRLVRQIGRKSNGKIQVAIPHEWLAEMTAMTQYNVSRILSKWQRQGVVSVRRGIIDIQNYDGLKLLCQESGISVQ